MRKSVSPQMFLLWLRQQVRQQQQQVSRQPPRAASRLKLQQRTASPQVVQVLRGGERGALETTDINILKATDRREPSLNQCDSVFCLQQSRQSSVQAKTLWPESADLSPTEA